MHAPTLARVIGIGVRSGMATTAEKIPDPAPVQVPRSDTLAAVISIAVAVLAARGLLPLNLTPDQLLAIGAGLAGLLAGIRALWERRAQLNRNLVLAAKDDAIRVYQTTLADELARSVGDRAKLAALTTVMQKAVDPADPTTLSPQALLDMLASWSPGDTGRDLDLGGPGARS